VWHFVTKNTGLKSVKPRKPSRFSKSGNPTYVNTATCPKCPRIERRTKSFRLQSPATGKRPKVCPRTRWLDYITDLAWSRLGVEPAELSELADDREVLQVLLGLLPSRPSPKEKRHENEKMNECVDLHWTFLFMKLSVFVCQKWMSYSNKHI